MAHVSESARCSLLEARLREEADTSEKGLAFMGDPELIGETQVQIAMLREAADAIETWKRTASLAANDAAALRELVSAAYDLWGGAGWPPNPWRAKAEALNARPGAKP